jgi:hypothetical protein
MHADEAYGLKEIERLLDVEINNWMRWARQRNYLPASVRCVLGQLHIRDAEDKAEEMIVTNPLPPDELEAEAFEAAIVSLPTRLRRAFVLHHLDRGHVGHITVRVKNRHDKAAVLGVGARQYHVLVMQAHQLVLRKWQAAGLVDDA